MRSKNYKGKMDKRSLDKCIGVCITYDNIQKKMADMLSEDPNVKEFTCNILIEDALSKYTSDLVAKYADGAVVVFECCNRKHLSRPSTIKHLEASRSYWLNHGISKDNWRIVIDEEE